MSLILAPARWHELRQTSSGITCPLSWFSSVVPVPLVVRAALSGVAGGFEPGAQASRLQKKGCCNGKAVQEGLGVVLRWMLRQRPRQLACVIESCGPPGLGCGGLGAALWSAGLVACKCKATMQAGRLRSSGPEGGPTFKFLIQSIYYNTLIYKIIRRGGS